MKYIKNILPLIFILLGYQLPAQSIYALDPGYVFTIHGSSNLHDWDESAGSATANASFTWNSNGSFDVNSLNLSVAVESIKSTEGSIMNNKTYNALKSGKYPVINFVLTAPIKSITPNVNGNAVTATGNLTIAGVTKPVTIQAKVFTNGQNAVTFEGSQKINMNDFGIDSPTALFGMLKVTPDVTIKFKTSFIAK
jgi:polyisoprenoid-binding protein YceI